MTGVVGVLVMSLLAHVSGDAVPVAPFTAVVRGELGIASVVGSSRSSG